MRARLPLACKREYPGACGSHGSPESVFHARHEPRNKESIRIQFFSIGSCLSLLAHKGRLCWQNDFEPGPAVSCHPRWRRASWVLGGRMSGRRSSLHLRRWSISSRLACSRPFLTRKIRSSVSCAAAKRPDSGASRTDGQRCRCNHCQIYSNINAIAAVTVCEERHEACHGELLGWFPSSECSWCPPLSVANSKSAAIIGDGRRVRT